MRSKTVLSHSPLFGTILHNACHVAVAAALTAWSGAALAQTAAAGSTPWPDAKTRRDQPGPTVVRAERITGRPERFIEFEDQVEVTRDLMTFNADKAIYRSLEDEVEAWGHIRMRKQGDCYRGDALRLKLDTGAGFVENPVYKLQRNNAQGHARRIDFESEERSVIRDGTYSTCEGLDPDWYLRADTLKLDTGLDTGVASKSVLYFKDVPILAVPGLSFPLSGARHSGFLPPRFDTSTKGGLELTVPYYFNIAPNRDLTVYPKLITRRGLQLGLEGRYLDENYSGETTVEGLLNDKQTGTNRYALASIHQQKLLPNVLVNWNINMASDDDYPADFSHSITKTAQRLLMREANLMYFGSFWNVSLRASNYQVLQDQDDPIDRPYDRLPQLQFHAEQHDTFGFDWAFDALLTRFWHPEFERGDRFVLNPQISLPLVRPGYFITPKLSLHASKYQLIDPIERTSDDLQRVVPTFSLDSGLVFERQTSLFGKPVTQTLEPRLFYVKTPFRDQSDFPNFDSALADFNFAQIFSENRFTGHDRIGDSNQITAALVSRYIEGNGNENLKLAIGQRFYFNTQKVTLDDSVNPSRSDMLLAAAGNVSDSISAEAALQISQSSHQTVRSNIGLRWQPAPRHVVNAAYRFQRDTLEQLDFSTQWPVAERWYLVGRSNYSLMDKKFVDGLAGFEYRADCWALRLVGQRFVTATSAANTTFFLQLELSGLGRLGSNPLEALKRNISGYQSINER